MTWAATTTSDRDPTEFAVTVVSKMTSVEVVYGTGEEAEDDKPDSLEAGQDGTVPLTTVTCLFKCGYSMTKKIIFVVLTFNALGTRSV